MQKFEFPKYGSIENLQHNRAVLDYELVATEKLHGTNTRLMWTKQGLWVGGGNMVISSPDNPVPKHDGYDFYDYAKTLPAPGPAYFGYVFYGEWHGPGIQKGVQYSDARSFRVFDVRRPDGVFCGWATAGRIAGYCGFDIVVELFAGKVEKVSQLDGFMDIESPTAIANGVTTEGDNIAEGIVLRPLHEQVNARGNRIIAKYKSEKWAELSKSHKVKKALSQEDLDAQSAMVKLAETLCTPGRVATVVEHITRDGNADVSISRTGDFIRAFVPDVMKDNIDVVQALTGPQRRALGKALSAKASQLFRQFIIKGEF